MRLPFQFIAYLIYRVIVWHERSRLIMKHGPEAAALYLSHLPLTFKGFKNG